jgi:hypothetical protein
MASGDADPSINPPEASAHAQAVGIIAIDLFVAEYIGDSGADAFLADRLRKKLAEDLISGAPTPLTGSFLRLFIEALKEYGDRDPANIPPAERRDTESFQAIGRRAVKKLQPPQA